MFPILLGPRKGNSHGNPLLYSWWENPMDRGAWQAIVHGVTQSRTWLKWLRMHTHYISSTYLISVSLCILTLFIQFSFLSILASGNHRSDLFIYVWGALRRERGNGTSLSKPKVPRGEVSLLSTNPARREPDTIRSKRRVLSKQFCFIATNSWFI